MFPGSRLALSTTMTLVDRTMTMVLRRMGLDETTVHGFRSTLRTWGAECTDFRQDVVEMALAHTVSDKVERAYRRGDLFQKRRQLADAWAKFCAAPVATDRVVPLRVG